MIPLKADLELNIVLYQPEIPANTGNIGRLCVGTNSTMHLIRPFRFLIDDKSLKRAGLDYWPMLKIELHESWDSFLEKYPERNIWLCTTKTEQSFTEVSFQKGDFLVFGPESRGLPEELLNLYPDRCISIPMHPNIRSINLSNATAIILYEAVRQINPS